VLPPEHFLDPVLVKSFDKVILFLLGYKTSKIPHEILFRLEAGKPAKYGQWRPATGTKTEPVFVLASRTRRYPFLRLFPVGNDDRANPLSQTPRAAET